jgi:uncharacterized membrane protein YfcA
VPSPTPSFQKLGTGVFVILTGLTIAFFGASGSWRGAEHRESDLDKAVVFVLGGFVVSLSGFILLVYRCLVPGGLD